MKDLRLRKSAPLPARDQINSTTQIVEQFKKKDCKKIVLLGATGTGKTATMAYVINELQESALIVVPNKTLAMQIYHELQTFFEDNVEYYVSYFDYYRPESYKPSSHTYLEKRVQRNATLMQLRAKAMNSLTQGKKTVVVASVAAIYGCGDPAEHARSVLFIKKGEKFVNTRSSLKKKLIQLGYIWKKSGINLDSGSFSIESSEQVKNSIFFNICNSEKVVVKVEISEEIIMSIKRKVRDKNNFVWKEEEEIFIYPCTDRVGKDESVLKRALHCIKEDLHRRVEELTKLGQYEISRRLSERVKRDVVELKMQGYCAGIENYSLYLDGRIPGQPPYTLLDYFGQERWLTIIDESHLTVPQISAMYNTDRSRKKNLVDYGFRLPSAFDNRPLNKKEFFDRLDKVLFVSATPSAADITQAKGKVVEQIIRPTHIVDPLVTVRKTSTPVRDLLREIRLLIKNRERCLVYTISIQLADYLSELFAQNFFNSTSVHSKLTVFERHQRILGLRRGTYSVLVGVNLLREGIDLPEVSTAFVLDADKTGFLRSKTSLIQIIGRTARNLNGRVILYARKTTQEIKDAIQETERRRAIQLEYNRATGNRPVQIKKVLQYLPTQSNWLVRFRELAELKKKDFVKFKKERRQLEREMKSAAKQYDFNKAITIRDILGDLDSIPATY